VDSADKGPTPSTSAETARRVLERTRSADGSPDVNALWRACANITESLREALGDDGSDALMTRALTRTAEVHPAAGEWQLRDGDLPLDTLRAAAKAHGITTVASAIETLIAALVEVLVRLIGEEMTIRLIQLDGPSSKFGERSS
jgi:hypothetical protein